VFAEGALKGEDPDLHELSVARGRTMSTSLGRRDAPARGSPRGRSRASGHPGPC
jgi:hypothetical protein